MTANEGKAIARARLRPCQPMRRTGRGSGMIAMRISNRLHDRRARSRRGTTAVEAAFVLPVFLFFVLALIEFGHAQMVMNVLHSACRTGVRLGSTEGASTPDVETRVSEVIGSAINSSAASVLVKDAGVFDSEGPYPETASDFAALPAIDLTATEPRQLFMVHVSVNYNDIALVPMPFMDGVVLDAQAFMRHE